MSVAATLLYVIGPQAIFWGKLKAQDSILKEVHDEL